jgi:hypothetical protein
VRQEQTTLVVDDGRRLAAALIDGAEPPCHFLDSDGVQVKQSLD